MTRLRAEPVDLGRDVGRGRGGAEDAPAGAGFRGRTASSAAPRRIAASAESERRPPGRRGSAIERQPMCLSGRTSSAPSSSTSRSSRPVVVEVGDLAARPDDDRLRAARRASSATASCRRGPGLAGDPGDQGEPRHRREVDGSRPCAGRRRPRRAAAVTRAPSTARSTAPGRGPVRGARCRRRPPRRRVELPEFDAVRVELVVLELHRLRPAPRAWRGPLGCSPFAPRSRAAISASVPRVEQPEHLEELDELAARLVGPGDDLLRDRRPLGRVRLEQRRRGLAAEHGGELPGEVVGVLDRGVGAETVARRVPVDGVAGAEHPPRLQVAWRTSRCCPTATSR